MAVLNIRVVDGKVTEVKRPNDDPNDGSVDVLQEGEDYTVEYFEGDPTDQEALKASENQTGSTEDENPK